jgi:hypothetical protein
MGIDDHVPNDQIPVTTDQQALNVPVDDTTNQEILRVLTDIHTAISDTTVQQTTLQLLDSVIVIGNLLVGFLMGYIVVKGMVEPWK